MKNLIEITKEIYDFVAIYGKDYGFIFCLWGIFGAIVAQAKKRQKWVDFAFSLITSVFVAWIVGVSAEELLNLSPKVTYCLAGIGGHFSKEVLDELKEVIESLSEYIKKFIDKFIK